MRQGQQNNKRMRGRNRKGPNPLTRSYESNGPDVKIRGTALHIAEKYVALARDAQSSGDRVAAENYLQHAEHYYRIVAAAQAQLPQPQPFYRNEEDGEDEFEERGGFAPAERMGAPRDGESAFGPDSPQPYVNGQHGGFNGSPRPEAQVAQPPPMVGEAEGEEGDAGGLAAGSEQPQYRMRRRRPNRGRFRRQDGEGGNPGQQGNGGGQQGSPAPAPDGDPGFGED